MIIKMKKRNRNPINWKIDDEKIAWSATVIILALLIVILCSCKTHRETKVNYEITSSESYQERRAEEHERQMAVKTAERRDTVKEASTHSGQIDIERDTAGRAVKIIYEHIFNGIQTQGSFRIDTVYQKQVIVLRDSVGSGRNDTLIDGKVNEKKDLGVNSWVSMGFFIFWLLIAVAASVLFIWVKKWKG